jgi:Mlc titration factor MtfA (ptsG expression regulator)
LKADEIEYLYKKNTYYRKLDEDRKEQFEYRVKLFLEDKEFIAKKMQGLSQIQKVLIASSAVQLTFGFKAIRLIHFQRIFVYPNAYKSSITGKYHRGEVNSAGAIVFSWEDFLKGYEICDDGINVGIHEMAHAMYLVAP